MSLRKKLGLRLVWFLGFLQQLIFAYVIRERFWRSSDGSTLFVSEMSDRHLRNAMRVLERENETHTKKYAWLVEEKTRRADRELVDWMERTGR